MSVLLFKDTCLIIHARV